MQETEVGLAAGAHDDVPDEPIYTAEEIADNREYCRMLREADRSSQEQYDKLVIALSGGGFGVSLAFLSDVVTGPLISAWALKAAWACWLISLFSALLGYYTSHKGIQQLLVDRLPGPCDVASNGWIRATLRANVVAGLMCVAGGIFIAAFTMNNISSQENRSVEQQDPSTTAATPTPAGPRVAQPGAGQRVRAKQANNAEEVSQPEGTLNDRITR
jgi:hypothetical protein